MDQAVIRAKIRAKLATGDLPDEHCPGLGFGPGAERRCAACDAEIGPADVQCECKPRVGAVLWFHKSCLKLWAEERIG